MTTHDIKEYIIINDKIEYVLEELRCHNIKSHDNCRYFTAGFPNGDNKKGFTIYTDNLYVDSNTKNIKDKYGNSDIISLVVFIRDTYFSNAIKWLCDILGLDYYSEEAEDIPLSLQLTSLLMDMNEDTIESDDIALKPINENILDTYCKCGNELFYNDGVSYKTQREFEIGLDLDSGRITVPIRDEISTLVGVKGRLFNKDDVSSEKYIYLERCSKSKILYGLHKTISHIQMSRVCIVVESEKSVLALWDRGIKNAVSIGGHILSKTQVEKITRLGVSEVVLCYDQEVNRSDNGKIDRSEYVKEANKFIPQITVSAMVDLNGSVLKEKESPVDNYENYTLMYDERKVLQIGK